MVYTAIGQERPAKHQTNFYVLKYGTNLVTISDFVMENELICSFNLATLWRTCKKFRNQVLSYGKEAE